MEVCKREINRRVEEKGKEEWLRGMNEKSTVDWYRGRNQSKYENFYDGSFGGNLLFRVRTKSLEVKSRVSRWKNGECKMCMMYEKGVDETVEHLMLECERYDRMSVQGLRR